MPPDLIIAFAVLAFSAIGVWMLGFRYGAKTLRDRNRHFVEMLEKDNSRRNPRSDWYRGYTEGIAVTLNTLERFLDGFKEKNDGSS